MEFTRFVRIEADIELILPTEFKARFRQGIVTDLRTNMSLGQVGRMRGDLVRDDAVLDVNLVRQTEMLFRRHVTQHRGTVPADLRCTYAL